MSLLGALIRAAGNERNSPGLLEYRRELIDRVNARISEQVSEIQSQREELKQTASGFDRASVLLKSNILNAMELETIRWKFYLRVYLTSRFKKIQSMLMGMVTPQLDLLSDAELEFTNQFKELISETLKTADPSSEEKIVFQDDIPTRENQFVFFQPLRDIGPYQLSSLSDAETTNVVKGQVYYARYDIVRPLLDSNEVFLV